MKSSKYDEIYELLKSKNRLDLLTNSMLQKSINEIYNILELQEFNQLQESIMK